MRQSITAFSNLSTERQIGALVSTATQAGIAVALGRPTGNVSYANPLRPPEGLVAAEREGLEAVYQARYVSGYQRAVADVDARLASGRLINGTRQPDHLFRANEIDAFARADLRRFAQAQGHGDDVVRINQRLYLEGTSGPYRVPDLYFPQSRTIFDGTLGIKSLTTPQIRDFRFATGNAPVGIVNPGVPDGIYWLGN